MDFILHFLGLDGNPGDKRRNILVIVDPQADFHPGGSLAVDGANEDSERVAAMIKHNIWDIDEIYVTLDSHHRNHIAHAVFWRDEHGQVPESFTLIKHADIVAKKWQPRNPNLFQHCLDYTEKLEREGKFTLCIWPEHCLIGSPGHNVVPVLNEALQEWSGVTGKSIHYVPKGQNCLTEMYSAIKADFEIESDPATKRDLKLQAELQHTERLLVCGEALSHCVNFTFCDILETWPHGENHRMVLLTDASSPVHNFEAQGQAFIDKIKAAGCTLMTTTEVFPVKSEQALPSHSHESEAAPEH